MEKKNPPTNRATDKACCDHPPMIFAQSKEGCITALKKTQEKLYELIKSGTLRQEIIISEEKFDELTSGL